MNRLLLLGLLISVLLPPALAQAQGSFESYAEYLPVVDPQSVLDGDIISLDAENYHRAAKIYDDRLFGVVNKQPAVGLNVVGGDNAIPIVTTGTVSVNVSTINGPIASGDFITTSEIPGVGMRANDPGMVLGIALEPFEADTTEDVGQISIAVNKHFAVTPTGDDLSIRRTIGAQVRNALVTGAVAAVSDPNTALRYTVGALVMLLSLVFGFLVFGRSAIKGIEAIGRNPLARRAISLAVAFNVFMATAFIAGGIVVAFFILAL